MAGRVQGKVAIVTGGASGLGAATVRRLAAEGASVVIADLNDAGADSVAAECRASGGDVIAHHTDVADREQVRLMVAAVAERFRRIDVLVNAAAFVPSPLPKVADIDVDVWERELSISLTGCMLTSKFVIPHMVAASGGSMIHFASAAAERARETNTGYGVVKAGVLALSRAIAAQYGRQGIRSNAISPGTILSKPRPADFVERALHYAMTRELGKPEDISATVLFLASDEAEFITAQTINVDGGLTMRLPNMGRPTLDDPPPTG